MKQFFLLCVMAGALLPTANATAADHHIDEWVGKVAPPYQLGYSELSGSCIGEGKDGADPCDTSIVLLRDEQSQLRVLLALRKLRDMNDKSLNSKSPMNLVTDALEAEALDAPDHEVATSLCQRDGVGDNKIVAVVPPQKDAEWFTKLAAAWRLDNNGRLQSIPTKGVRCRNEGFGYDG